MARAPKLREAFETVRAMAALVPVIAMAGCDVDERVSPVADASACRPTPFTPTPADSCGAYVHMPCGLPADVKPLSGPGCYFSVPACKRICGDPAFFSCHAIEAHCGENEQIVPGEDGAVDVDCVTCIGNAGRAFEGLAPVTAASSIDPIGAGLARMAWLEAASVRAFRVLAHDLTELGAPRALVARATVAARDEARHARVARAAATRHGAAVPRVSFRAIARRSRERVARENAVEGCVGETLAALLAAWDRERAPTSELRAVFSAIADDELAHGALAFDVHAFLARDLSPAARARVGEAARAALANALASPTVRRLPRPTRAFVSRAMRDVVRAAFSASQVEASRP